MILYGRISGVGIYAILLLMLMASIAVVVFFRRNSAPGTTIWKTAIIPGIAVLGLATSVFLATTNFETMTGITGPAGVALVLLTFAVAPAGVALAIFLRKRRTHAYERIGRQQG